MESVNYVVHMKSFLCIEKNDDFENGAKIFKFLEIFYDLQTEKRLFLKEFHSFFV